VRAIAATHADARRWCGALDLCEARVHAALRAVGLVDHTLGAHQQVQVATLAQ